MKMSDMQSTKYIMALWGPGKVGKTIFASQFPNNHYICVREDGLGSVRSMKKAYNLAFDIETFMIHNNPSTDPDLIALIGPQFAKMSAWDKMVKLATVYATKLTDQDVITWDHWTYICDALIEDIEKKAGHPMQLQDWNTFTQEMKTFLDSIKQPMMKASSIILAHDELFKSNLTGEITRSILMPTKMKNSFPSYPTEYLCMKTVITGAMAVRKVKRRLQSLADQSANTGSYAMIPDIDQPTYEKVRPYLEASLGRPLPPPLWTPPEDVEKKTPEVKK